MKKTLLAFLFAVAASASFAQLSWTPTPSTPITITGSLARSSAPSTNLFTSSTSNLYDGSAFQAVSFSGTDSANSLMFTFAGAAANDTTNFTTLGGNFKFTIVNPTGSTVMVPAGTYSFQFTIPASSSGFITGYSVVSDPGHVDSFFSYTFSGSSVTITQSRDFALPAATGAPFTGNFSSAIPEPSTYALICGLAMGGLVIWRRRSKSAVVAS